MTIKIFETRKTWIWFESYGQALAGGAPDGSLAARLASRSGYAELLERAKRESGPLSLPWPSGAGLFNNFWRRYLEGAPGEVGSNASWRHLMPLRRAVAVQRVGDAEPGSPPRIEDGGLPCRRLTLEALLYPHGVGLVATVYLGGELSLQETVERARDCFETVALTLVGEEGRKGPFKLSLLAVPLLGELRAWTGGPPTPELRSGPFSIATLINGGLAGTDGSVAEDDPVHRALWGLCTGDRYWEDTPAPSLEDHSLETKRGPEEHLLLASEDGRAVWFPRAFEASPGRRSTLGCYHRNLTLLSAQVESLLGLVLLARRDLDTSGQVRSGRLEDLARLAAQHLGRLYGRTDSTYRSASAPAQIEADDRKQAVDEVRDRLGIGGPLQR